MHRLWYWLLPIVLTVVSACSGGGGGDENPAPPEPIIQSFIAMPSTITVGETVTLSWVAKNASTVSLDNGIGVVSGSEYQVTPNQATTYTLMASNGDAQVSRWVTVNVLPANPLPPTILSFSATPNTVSSGDWVTLRWTVENASEIVVEGFGRVTGSELLVAPSTTTTYRLIARNAETSAQATTTVTVTVNDRVAELIRLGLAAPAGEQVKAFPGASGFASDATGGRGGRVITVTNLNASGPGSFAHALEQNEPRIIVFAVSGVIAADENVRETRIPFGNVTIAGQTAPGGGITLNTQLVADYGTENIIIRHLRVRPKQFDEAHGDEGDQYDAIQFGESRKVILDHVSVYNGVDETVDVYATQDITVQWSSIERSETSIGHPDWRADRPTVFHNYGLINGPDGGRISVHHNLFTHHRLRTPAIATGPAEVLNNTVYNVRHAFVHNNPVRGDFNIIGNLYKDGPDSPLLGLFFDAENIDDNPDVSLFVDDGFFIDEAETQCPHALVISNPWQQCELDLEYGLSEQYRADSRADFTGVQGYIAPFIQPVLEASPYVLRYAGAFPRDVISRQALSEVEATTGSWGARIPVDLMDGLVPHAAPVDSDNDGMPDEWELLNGGNPNENDSSRLMPTGYTAIEEYINQKAIELLLEAT